MHLSMKKMFESGNTAWLISNEEMNYIMKKVKSLEESSLILAKQLIMKPSNKNDDFWVFYLVN